MLEKRLWKSDILTSNVNLPHVFFKHFANKNQLPGFYISRKLVENGLIKSMIVDELLPRQQKLCQSIKTNAYNLTAEADLGLLQHPRRRAL